MKTNQKFYPEFGYTTPIETQEECSNPAFADKYLHRVGRFDLGEPNDNGCKGNRI